MKTPSTLLLLAGSLTTSFAVFARIYGEEILSSYEQLETSKVTLLDYYIINAHQYNAQLLTVGFILLILSVFAFFSTKKDLK